MLFRSEKLALLLHGFPESKFSWRFQLPLFARLGYTAWAPNLRGYGGTSRPQGRDAYKLELLLDDVAALIDAALERMGFATDVMMRNAETLARTIAANPFPDVAAARPAQLHVVFHRDPVPAEPVEALPGIHTGPERIRAVGRELFIDYPEGAGESLLPRAMAKLRFPKVEIGRAHV